MKKILFALVFVIGSSAFAAEKFDMTLSPSVAPVIKAVTTSCLARRHANAPTYDVAANFAQFKGLSLSFQSTDKALVINTVEVKLGNLATFTIAADELNCLNNTWYRTGEAVVGGPMRAEYSDNSKTYQPNQTVAIEFPVQLAGLPGGPAYELTGKMTVYGTVENQAGDIEAVQAEAPLKITWRGQ